MHSWPHAPSKVVTGPGPYIITASTYQKQSYFNDAKRLQFLQETLFESALQFEWELQAWAIFSNHYHLVGICAHENGVYELSKRVHAITSQHVNRLDQTPGRKVWFRCWDTRITHEKSYLARLAYVHNNPAKHLGVHPDSYPFCSMHWFKTKADRPFYETVMGFPYEDISIDDEF